MQVTPLFEQLAVESGIISLKYWLEVSPEEQTRRLEGRINDGRKIWKLSPMDLESYSKKNKRVAAHFPFYAESRCDPNWLDLN